MGTLSDSSATKRSCVWGKSWSNPAWSQVGNLWLSPSKGGRWTRRYTTVCTEGQAVQAMTAGDRQPLCAGQGVEVWVPSAVAGILLLKWVTGAQGSRQRGAAVSCVLYTGHQWKIDGWICLFCLSWIKPCYISVTELRMKSLSNSVVLKTKRII